MKTWIAQLACGKRLKVSAMTEHDAAVSAALEAGWIPFCGQTYIYEYLYTSYDSQNVKIYVFNAL